MDSGLLGANEATHDWVQVLFGSQRFILEPKATRYELACEQRAKGEVVTFLQHSAYSATHSTSVIRCEEAKAA